MTQINIKLENITLLEVEAIVNAAKESLLGGGGVDGEIHKIAGSELLEECIKLNGCKTGFAKITKGYNLKAKFVIHTVGPIWIGGNNNEKSLLESCYIESLKLAVSNNIKSIAFPCISTGVYWFPKEIAAQIAIKAIKDFIEENPEKINEIIFCCFTEEDFNYYKNII